MPIYAYKCSTCGYAADVMQKMSDAVLTVCPKCSAETYAKQVTAPNFALKGSGWYVTDFRNGNNGGNNSGNKDGGAKPTESAKSADAAPAPTAAPAANTPAMPSAAPAPAATPAAPSSPSSTASAGS